MENNIIILNKSSDFRSLFLDSIRNTWIAEIFYLYLIVPMGILGTILNIITLIIYYQNKKKLPLFKYLIVYSACCVIIAIIGILFFYVCPYQLFDLAVSYFGRIFKCYILSSNGNFLFFYINSLDVLINFERTLNFCYKFQKLKEISPYKICLVVLILCLIINIPNNMAQEMVQTEDLPVKLKNCVATSFALKPYGKILLLVSFFIQGPLLLLLILISNILSVLSFKNFMKLKAEILKINKQQLEQMTSNEEKKLRKYEKLDKNLLKMTFFMSLFSFVNLFIQFVANTFILVFPNQFNNFITGSIMFIFVFVVCLKQFLNFFFQYYFNLKFKKHFHKLFAKTTYLCGFSLSRE
jgi:hypothetical protein